MADEVTNDEGAAEGEKGTYSLVVEAVDTDQLLTATRARLIIEGDMTSIAFLAEVVYAMIGGTVDHATAYGPDGQRDITGEFNVDEPLGGYVDLLSTGDDPGSE